MKLVFSIKPLGHGKWAVIDQHGHQHYGPTWRLSDAESVQEARQCAENKRVSQRMRPCLKCQREFLSQGIHNRLCAQCSREVSSHCRTMTG